MTGPFVVALADNQNNVVFQLPPPPLPLPQEQPMIIHLSNTNITTTTTTSTTNIITADDTQTEASSGTTTTVSITIGYSWNDTVSTTFLNSSSSNSSTHENNDILFVVEILSLPQHGILSWYNHSNNSSNARISVTSHPYTNHRLPIRNDETFLTLQYQLLDTKYFNTLPSQHNINNINNRWISSSFQDSTNHISYNNDNIESFQFRIRVYNTTNQQLLALSSTTTQVLHVVHVNHPGTLVIGVPNTTTTTTTRNVVAVVVDRMVPTEAIVLLRPIQYQKTDPYNDNLYDIEYVRVDLWVDYGSLTIHPIGLQLARFSSCTNRTASTTTLFVEKNDNLNDTDTAILWNCQGKGIQNQNMTFLARPNDIESILRYLLYETNDTIASTTTLSTNASLLRVEPNPIDTITIRISDGIGGMCLSAYEHEVNNKNYNTVALLDGSNHLEQSTTMPFASSLSQQQQNTIRRSTEVCYQTMATIQIMGLTSDSSMNNNTSTSNDNDLRVDHRDRNGFLKFITIADVVFWSMICIMIVIGRCMYRKIVHCVSRGRPIDIVVDDTATSTIHAVHPNHGDGCSTTAPNAVHDDEDEITATINNNSYHERDITTQTTTQRYRNEIWYRNAIAPPTDLVSDSLEAI
jgi:hypothetical protein